MCILEDSPILISSEPEIYYKIRSVHRRGGNPAKCIWTISLQEEVDCFKLSVHNNWLEETKGWGVKINSEGGLDQVGVSEQDEILKIAKFVDSSSTGEWHGYPADYNRRIQDKPSLGVLMDWKKRGLISKVQMSKIKQGKKCSL